MSMRLLALVCPLFMHEVYLSPAIPILTPLSKIRIFTIVSKYNFRFWVPLCNQILIWPPFTTKLLIGCKIMHLISLFLVILEILSSLLQKREDEIPTIIQIPKQLPMEQFKQVIPLEWITNYEKAFQKTTLVIASDTKYVKQRDGSIKTIYETIEKPSALSSTPPLFQSLMIQPVTFEDDILIHSFHADESPVYTNKINGHFIWDIDPSMCDADCDCRNCLRISISACKPLHKPYEPDDPNSP
ncbi:hypothetical protein Ddye_011972 [Dipteronia dyeriana]|uniref:Uncharacterized protein n=1 Tax=Dipteronia dyeriana TaxID=168575 RepID=A0AAD9X3L1_9ROSI|nr:hypothetical protein Ddye_011972 [Dipteronia dyeriana]